MKKVFAKHWSTLLIIFAISLSSKLIAAQEENLLPSNILLLDNFFTHHVIVAEKATHQLHLFENQGSYPKLIQTFQMASGKKAGNKVFQGDHRTPEGAYFITDFIPKTELLTKFGKEGEIYGVGAFVLDYPNPIDTRQGKSGGGIWLHSTNDETRIDKGLDSRGCLVTANQDLKNISQYLELGRTPVVVVHNLMFLKESTWNVQRKEITDALENWLQAWREENIEGYMNFYHPTDFTDKSKGNYKNFKEYKKAVFANPGKPDINLTDISILIPGDYAVVTFKQIYHSDKINDTGKKTLYLKKDEYYQWKIVTELWSRIQGDKDQPNNGNAVAFRPSMRFFPN